MIDTALVILIVGLLVALLLWAFQKLLGIIPLSEPAKGVINAIVIVIIVLVFVLWAAQKLGLSI